MGRVNTGIILFALSANLASAQLPPDLHGTGLTVGASQEIAPENVPFVPQYPLWSDGADKRRWVFLPEKARIDVERPDAWVFPVGTKFWKEFSFFDVQSQRIRRIETRYFEKAARGNWLFGTYLWNTSETEALLAPSQGVPQHFQMADGKWHRIPSRSECLHCHGGSRREPILGFEALQLSPDRDPFAPHAEPFSADSISLTTLANQNRFHPQNPAFLRTPPRIAANSETGRAAMGYLHVNCGSCHNPENSIAVLGMFLRHPSANFDPASESAWQTTVNQLTYGFQIPGTPSGTFRIRPKNPEMSAVFFRMSQRDPRTQMPPLGTESIDVDALNLMRRWIHEMR